MDKSGTAAERPESVPPGISLFFCLLALLTVATAVYLVEIAYIGHPLSTAKLWSQDNDGFGDFWHYRVLLLSLHRPTFFAANDRFAYPAPCALLYLALYHFGSRPHVSFDAVLWAVQAGSALLLLRALLGRQLRPVMAVMLVVLMAISSYPWHMLYDRGNIELFVYLPIALGCWAWLCGKEEQAALLWGCAASLKLYPCLLLMLFARRGHWRSFWIGMATCCALLLFSFWYVGPTIAIAAKGTVLGVLGFVGNYGARSRTNELVFDHSLLASLKNLAIRAHINDAHQTLLSHMYEAGVILLGPALYLRWRRRAWHTNELCLLLVCMVALPPVSYDYTLIHVYLVIGIVLCAFLESAARGAQFPGWRSYAAAFAVLCTSEVWLQLWRVEVNGLLKTAALIGVGILLVRYPLELQALGKRRNPVGTPHPV